MAMFSIPSRGHDGGWPGSSSRIQQLRGTDVHAQLADGRWPTPETLDVGETFLSPPKHSPLRLHPGDVMRHFTGGGAGFGDPLLRDPEVVARGVRDGWLTADHARLVHGVAVGAGGALDAAGTDELRRSLRRERIGREPVEPGGWPVPEGAGWIGLYLVEVGGRVGTTTTGEDLCAAGEDWRDHVIARETELARRLHEVGMWAAPHPDTPIVLVEHYAPACGTTLLVEVTVQGRRPTTASLERHAG
jgi:N-methylhydantoinase B